MSVALLCLVVAVSPVDVERHDSLLTILRVLRLDLPFTLDELDVTDDVLLIRYFASGRPAARGNLHLESSYIISQIKLHIKINLNSLILLVHRQKSDLSGSHFSSSDAHRESLLADPHTTSLPRAALPRRCR